MENASKALIIAGAILLSILIIALGIFIYSQARSAINTNPIDTATIRTFNEPIEEYEGSTLGSNLKSLMTTLIAGAATYEGSSDFLPTVKLEDINGNTTEALGGSDAATDKDTYVGQLTTIRNALVTSHNYTVEITEYNAAGLVSIIEITY